MEDEFRPMIHIRLPRPLLRQVDHASVDMDQDRARTIEKLLELGLEVWRQGGQSESALVSAGRASGR